jgi:hypothetical protein
MARSFLSTARWGEVSVWADFEFFARGSVYDGELVGLPTQEVHFLVFDALVCAGVPLANGRYSARHAHIANVFAVDVAGAASAAELEAQILGEHKIAAVRNAQDISLVPKRVVGFGDLEALWEESMPYRHSGILLLPAGESAVQGTHDLMFKWDASSTIRLNELMTASKQYKVLSQCRSARSGSRSSSPQRSPRPSALHPDSNPKYIPADAVSPHLIH